VLRGSHPAKIDDKGRLKIPTEYRTFIVTELETSEVYVTTDDADGQYVRVYPMPVWNEIEAKLAKMPSTDPSRRRFERWTSVYGQTTEIDAQGRVVIHTLLRDRAAMLGDVRVMGLGRFLEVWNQDRLLSQGDAHRLTIDDYHRLSEFDI
jgi:MraZ protein